MSVTPSSDNPTFSCKCFGPGLAPQGRRTQAEIQKDHLAFTIEGRLIRLPWKTCSVSLNDANLQQLVLSWRVDGSDWKVVSSAEDAFERVSKNAPAHLQKQLDRWRQGVTAVNKRSRLSVASAAIVAATLAIALAAILILRKQMG